MHTLHGSLGFTVISALGLLSVGVLYPVLVIPQGVVLSPHVTPWRRRRLRACEFTSDC